MSNFDSIETEKIGFLDIGNSSIKLGLRNEDHWEIQVFYKPDDLTVTLLSKGIEYLIVCNVRPSVDWLENLSNHFSVAVLETDDIHPSKLKYKTPQTLGMDRYLACFGAWSLFKSPVVVIDSGSACTIDYMDQEGVFHGGVIMPGIQTLLGVFHKSAPGLPKFEFQIPEKFPGYSSQDSLQWGLSQLFLDGMRANLTRLDLEFEDYNLILTGGDAELLSEVLDREHSVRPDLIFMGMEAFLES